MEKYFNIRYVFGKENVWRMIDGVIERGEKGFVVVADGVVVNIAQRDLEYKRALDESLFAICDSSWVPLYLRWTHGIRRKQYCGSMIFEDCVDRRKHRMFFMGAEQSTLDGLKAQMVKRNPDIENMTFYELPFLNVEEFDYEGIARMIEEDGADIIWVALGAPKQCLFMSRLLPYLKHGVMIGVGAVFKFYSGKSEKRAPDWMLNGHLEFVYRIIVDPKKQLKRCWWIIKTLPSMLWEERKRANKGDAYANDNANAKLINANATSFGLRKRKKP